MAYHFLGKLPPDTGGSFLLWRFIIDRQRLPVSTRLFDFPAMLALQLTIVLATNMIWVPGQRMKRDGQTHPKHHSMDSLPPP